jgi:hypothetical protein
VLCFVNCIGCMACLTQLFLTMTVFMLVTQNSVVPLPWVDVGWPGGRNLGVGAGGVGVVLPELPPPPAFFLFFPLPVPPLLSGRDGGAGVGAGGLAIAGAGQV